MIERMTFVSTNKELIVWIEPKGFMLDWQATNEVLGQSQLLRQEQLYEKFHQNAFEFLFALGFLDSATVLSDSIRFLAGVAASFVKALSRDSDIEFLREKTIVQIDREEVEQIIRSAPYMNGVEYVDIDWVDKIWGKLGTVFSSQIKEYSGSVAGYFAAQSPDIHIVGRVFFHLVENKKEEYPFAFLATYATRAVKGGKSKHLPLKNALVEYKDDNTKLLELLSTVNKVSQNSTFIAELVDSGEMNNEFNCNL